MTEQYCVDDLVKGLQCNGDRMKDTEKTKIERKKYRNMNRKTET